MNSLPTHTSTERPCDESVCGEGFMKANPAEMPRKNTYKALI